MARIWRRVKPIFAGLFLMMAVRGHGVGKKLLNEAMRFCDSAGFSAVHLWTFNKLTAARRLYESFGFTLVKEWEGDQWGSLITEQQFTRHRGRNRA
jgi:GNAT superfamily N-acetyltransferase